MYTCSEFHERRLMASFGTGVATGTLHEMTDVTMATDWEKISIHHFTNHPEPEKENISVEKNDGEAEVFQERTFEKVSSNNDPEKTFEKSIDKEWNNDSKEEMEKTFDKNCGKGESMNTNEIEDEQRVTPKLDKKSMEAVLGVENMDTVHPVPKVLTNHTLENELNELKYNDKGPTNLELSQEIVDEFQKHLQTKKILKAESQFIPLEQPSRPGSDKSNVISNKQMANHRTVTMATYTCTKPARKETERQTPAGISKITSGPPSRQTTTSSSAGDRGYSQNDCSFGKPDSGHSKRRRRRQQEDTKSNNSRYGEDPRDEAVGGNLENDHNESDKRNDGYLNDRFQSPRQLYGEGATQKTLLELMTRGLGNFTEQMANLMIEKIRPEYETLSRQVAKEVQEATMYELKELREKIINAQKALKDLEKEKDHAKKLLDNEKSKRIKETEEKDLLIKKLEKDLEQSKASLKERDRIVKKAEHRAKAEEQKRMQLEQDYQEQCTKLKRLLDRAKGDLLVYRSQKRVALTMEKQETVTLKNRLDSHH